MGVYIKGMEMPRKCRRCPVNVYGRCLVNDDKDVSKATADAVRDKDCPLVPVPPHGDLIDRREAIIDANERAYDFWLSDDEVNATIQFLNEQHAVIPAEEEQSGNSGELEDKP